MPTFLERFETALQSVAATVASSSSTRPLRISVVGGGAAGTEVAFCLEAMLKSRQCTARVSLIDAGDNILKGYLPALTQRARDTLAAREIDVITGRRASGYNDQQRCLEFVSGEPHPADLVIWAAAASAPPDLQGFDLPKTEKGFLAVQQTLQTTAAARVFAVGDTATIVDNPVPKAGVYAVREGPVLWDNIQRLLRDEPLQNYEPQRGFLSLLATGDGRAIGQYKGRAFGGKWAWAWKNHIDKKFMRMYQDYRPAMSAPAAATDTADILMKCRGCGGKVGGGVLSAVFDRLDIPTDPTVIQGLDQPDDAAILATQQPVDVLSVDFFQAFLDDPYLVGRIAALNSLSDLWASGCDPAAALAVVGLPAGEPARQAELLYQLLAGSLEELNRAGCTLVGGHTIESGEVMIGFTVLGRLRGREPFRKAAIQPGDQLILTKPLGTGILLAGNMQALARAEWMTAGLTHMLANNATPAQRAREHDVCAVTDVTGFGLAGHLLEMLNAGRCTARLSLDALPILDGVRELFLQGVRSTLDEPNRGIEGSVRADAELKSRPEYTILFDPQTSGGMLLAVPESKADVFLNAGGWRIGDVVDGPAARILVEA